MDLSQLITWTFQASIVATSFGLGLKAVVEDLRDLVRRPAVLARSLLAMFVVMPVIAVLLAHAFEFRHTVEVALIALAICPLPAVMPNKLSRQGGRPAHATALMATFALLSIVIVPLLVALLERYSGRSLAVSRWTVAGVIALSVLLPLAAGMVFRAMRPALADRIEPVVSSVGSVLLRLAAVALLVTTLPAIWAAIGNGTVIAIVIFVMAGLAAGHLLGGPDADGRAALALATASRHPATALAIASASFPGRHFGATILLYLLVSAVVGVPYTLWQRRKARDIEAAAAILEARQKAVDDIRAGRPAPYLIASPGVSTPSDASETARAVKKNAG